MSSTVSALLILLVMVAAYIAAQLFKLSTELSIFVAALAGALAGGEWLPVRHLAEGAITYLDICLIFFNSHSFHESGAGSRWSSFCR
jgi:hypothetical protein